MLKKKKKQRGDIEMKTLFFWFLLQGVFLLSPLVGGAICLILLLFNMEDLETCKKEREWLSKQLDELLYKRFEAILHYGNRYFLKIYEVKEDPITKEVNKRERGEYTFEDFPFTEGDLKNGEDPMTKFWEYVRKIGDKESGSFCMMQVDEDEDETGVFYTYKIVGVNDEEFRTILDWAWEELEEEWKWKEKNSE